MSARYERAVLEAFFWSEVLDNGGSFADYGVTATPGIQAALSGFWRGRNKADNEELENQKQNRVNQKEREERRKRYVGKDD